MSDALRHYERGAELPTLTDAAALIMVDATEVGRAVSALGIEPIAPRNGESRLAIADVFRVAIHAKRSALEEVGGGMLEWAEREHPDQVDVIRAEVDAFFATLPERKAADREEFIASLRAGLPPQAAEQAIQVYLDLRESPQQ